MQILIKPPISSEHTNGETKLPELSIIELQGDIGSKVQGSVAEPNANNKTILLSNQFVGNLFYTAKSQDPILIIGHHILVGKIEKLEKPFALLEKKVLNDKTEYLVRGIISKKLVFSDRPKPIIKVTNYNPPYLISIKVNAIIFLLITDC